MYERFYNLRERPFSLTPDPDYLYLSRVHREGLNHLRYGIESHAGFVVITGEIGCGKTTLLQTVMRGLDQRTSVSRLVHTMLDSRELIEAVMLDFGLEPAADRSKPYLLRDLARYLVDQRNAGRLALLIVDEAQNLSESALEEIRMLSNLETEKSKLIQIVLIGQPNLRENLARPALEQLRQRVTVNYHLKPMDADETGTYINHRLKRAAIGAPLTFPVAVTDLIHRHSRGVARKVNIISDAVLLFGYGAGKHVIDIELAREVILELGCETSDDVLSGPSPVETPRQPAVAPPASPPAEAPVASRPLDTAPLAAAVIDPPIRRVVLEVPPAAMPTSRPRQTSYAARPLSAPAGRYAPPGYRTLGERPARGDGIWSRLRRGLFGFQKPIFEE
jgi:putative secretion ATPase (PEP-CTERM system associated)